MKVSRGAVVLLVGAICVAMSHPSSWAAEQRRNEDNDTDHSATILRLVLPHSGSSKQAKLASLPPGSPVANIHSPIDINEGGQSQSQNPNQDQNQNQNQGFDTFWKTLQASGSSLFPRDWLGLTGQGRQIATYSGSGEKKSAEHALSTGPIPPLPALSGRNTRLKVSSGLFGAGSTNDVVSTQLLAKRQKRRNKHSHNHLQGSGRLGMLDSDKELYDSAPGSTGNEDHDAELDGNGGGAGSTASGGNGDGGGAGSTGSGGNGDGGGTGSTGSGGNGVGGGTGSTGSGGNGDGGGAGSTGSGGNGGGGGTGSTGSGGNGGGGGTGSTGSGGGGGNSAGTSVTSMGSVSMYDMLESYYQTQYGAAGYVPPNLRSGNPGYFSGSSVAGMSPFYSVAPPVPMSTIGFPTPTEAQTYLMQNSWVPTTGEHLTDSAFMTITGRAMETVLAQVSDPRRIAPVAQAAGQAAAGSAATAMADVTRHQAANAIDYAAKYLHNFTTVTGNKWNTLRDQIFVPIAILLLLPGAVLSQVRAIVAAGSPAIGQVNPFDGITRSLIAIFLIPGTYLVVNWGIDFSNSITLTISSEYERLFGSNMYRDAVCAEIRAFPVRQPAQENMAMNQPTAPQTPVVNPNGNNSATEGALYSVGVEDPCAGISNYPQDRPQEAQTSASVAARFMTNGMNAGITATWDILCAFQMAYLFYLFFVGPIVAALWVWPMKQFRDALPNWIEGVVTLCFWSLFWNTTVLLMACFKGVDDTGTIMMTALNFLSTACVKYAFDFVGLIRAAGQKAAEMAQESSGAGAGGSPSTGGPGTSSSNQNGQQGTNNRPRFVEQQQVYDPDIQHPVPRYRVNAQGITEEWNEQTNAYAATPTPIMLVSADVPTGGAPDVGLPPLAGAHMIQTPSGTIPEVFVDGQGRLYQYDPQTGQWHVPSVYDQRTGTQRDMYMVDADGRVAVWDAASGAYYVPQAWDREASIGGNDVYTDRYVVRDGALLAWNSSTLSYAPVVQETVVPPPTNQQTAGGGGAYFQRNSISSVVGSTIEPIMAYPSQQRSNHRTPERQRAEELLARLSETAGGMDAKLERTTDVWFLNQDDFTPPANNDSVRTIASVLRSRH